MAYQQLDRQQVTVTGSAQSLIELGFAAADVARAQELTCYVRANSINFDCGSDTPSTSSGIAIPEGGYLMLSDNTEISALKLVRNGSSNATVDIKLDGFLGV